MFNKILLLLLRQYRSVPTFLLAFLTQYQKHLEALRSFKKKHTLAASLNVTQLLKDPSKLLPCPTAQIKSIIHAYRPLSLS